MNLLKEIKEELARTNHDMTDVQWIGIVEQPYEYHDHDFKPFIITDWSILDTEYNDGYGIQEINPNLVVVGDNWWLERHEYDGSENFEYKELPKKPMYVDNNPKGVRNGDWNWDDN